MINKINPTVTFHTIFLSMSCDCIISLICGLHGLSFFDFVIIKQYNAFQLLCRTNCSFCNDFDRSAFVSKAPLVGENFPCIKSGEIRHGQHESRWLQ